jgi:hypothetical protein
MHPTFTNQSASRIIIFACFYFFYLFILFSENIISNFSETEFCPKINFDKKINFFAEPPVFLDQWSFYSF